ncbi:MAG TPA: O-antigen ligase family protein [Bryobacteraceae bacterium]|nr:O-antigen ligase family protein [Bryobacteraceae bacterium]
MCAPKAEQDWTARLFCGAVFLLPLVCWPQAASAFAAPKMLLLAVLDLGLAAALLTGKFRASAAPPEDWLALAWVAAVSISALAGVILNFDSLLLALLPVPVFWCIARGLVSLNSLARAVWLGTTCEALIVLLQFGGLDPLQALGWRPEAFPSPRMRAYGTLGNPDFVAAWCCAALPLCWWEIACSSKSRRALVLRWGAAVLQIAAILATGSRVFALAILVQAALVAWRSRAKGVWLWAPPLAAALLLVSSARPLAVTVEGRLYLARVTAGHWQTPLAGYGPGAFEDRFAVWQAEWLEAHREDSGAARFAGAIDHAHNDYLEFLVEYGPVGLGAFVVLAGWLAASAWRRPRPPGNLGCAALIGAATLLAIAAVDFPFHRPAEWSLLWLFLGILATARAKTRSVGDVNQVQTDRSCRGAFAGAGGS